MSGKLYKVGMYIRLSVENTAYKNRDSGSIENQQSLLTKFISIMPGWVETRTYIDNGATGANFNRQGFQDMMTDVRNGVINLVIVKDLSRFGRNYLETGHYLEEELPKYKCRFVALDDGVDTESGENDIMPVLNALNDYYLKNLSDRVKSVMTAKARDGQRIGRDPYGYQRDTEIHKLIVDESTALVVRRIYELRLDGTSYPKIAQALNADGISSPRGCFWTDCVVKGILRNEAYAGHLVQNRRTSLSHRNRKAVFRPEEDWIRVENAHEAIISADVWHQVQDINLAASLSQNKRRKSEPGIFAGLLYCADCGVRLCSNCNVHHNTKIFWYFCWSNKTTGGVKCAPHSIGEATLRKLVLAHIREQARLIALDRESVYKNLHHRLIGVQALGKSDSRKRQRELERQLHSIETQIEKLYEDKVMGVISGDTFSALSQKLEAEHRECALQCNALSDAALQSERKFAGIDRWMELIEENSSVDEVNRDLLESLIERIEIGEDRRVDGVKTKDVRIFYKYVGFV